MRKNIALIFAAIMVLSMSACGGNTQNSVETTAQTTTQAQIEETETAQETENTSAESESKTDEKTVDNNVEAQKIFNNLGSVAVDCLLNGTNLEDGTYLNVEYSDTEFFKAAQAKIDEDIESGYISGNYNYSVTFENNVIAEVEIFDEDGNSLGIFNTDNLYQ